MSYVFDDQNRRKIWVPALSLGELYVNIGAHLAAATGLPSGLTNITEDWCIVNPADMRIFIDNLISEHWHNPIFKELERGFVATSLRLLEACGEDIEDYVRLFGADGPQLFGELRNLVLP